MQPIIYIFAKNSNKPHPYQHTKNVTERAKLYPDVKAEAKVKTPNTKQKTFHNADN